VYNWWMTQKHKLINLDDLDGPPGPDEVEQWLDTEFADGWELVGNAQTQAGFCYVMRRR